MKTLFCCTAILWGILMYGQSGSTCSTSVILNSSGYIEDTVTTTASGEVWFQFTAKGPIARLTLYNHADSLNGRMHRMDLYTSCSPSSMDSSSLTVQYGTLSIYQTGLTVNQAYTIRLQKTPAGCSLCGSDPPNARFSRSNH